MKTRKAEKAVPRKNRAVYILGLFLFLLLLPSANYAVFSGVPLSTQPEFVALAIYLPMLFSRGLRRIYDRLLLGPWCLYARILLWCGLIAIVAKATLFISGTYKGFLACYKTPLVEPAVGGCEKSYENPFFRFNATRIDREISFDENNWNLSFVNSNRFNYYPWEEGVISRHRLPLEANWIGTINVTAPSQAEIEYVGEAKVDFGEGVVALPPSYKASSLVLLNLPMGRQVISIDFYFDDGHRTKQPDPPGPYAMMRVHLLRVGQDGMTRIPAGGLNPALMWRSLAYFVDAIMLAFLLGLIAFYGKFVKSEWWVLLVVGVLGILVFHYLPDNRWLPKTRGFLILIGMLFLYFLAKRKRRILLIIYASLFYFSILRSLLYVPDLNTTLIRDGGTDFLTYESFARAILESGSLEAGEAVFYYQPLFRYISFGTHFLFGDGDSFTAILSLTFLNIGVFWFLLQCFPGRHSPLWNLILAALAGLMLIALINSWHVVYFLHIGASEYPSWVLFPFIIYLLLIARQNSKWLLGTILLGTSILIRPNYGLALLGLYSLFLISICSRDRKKSIISAAVLAGMGIMPMIHNLYYGHELVFLPKSASVPENLVLPPKILLKEFGDPAVRAKAWEQFEWLFCLKSGENEFLGLSIALHGLQALWLLSLGSALLQWKSLIWKAKAMLLIPILYLGVQYFYVLNAVYPRHIIMGHIAMGYVVIYSLLLVSKSKRVAEKSERRLDKGYLAGDL